APRAGAQRFHGVRVAGLRFAARRPRGSAHRLARIEPRDVAAAGRDDLHGDAPALGNSGARHGTHGRVRVTLVNDDRVQQIRSHVERYIGRIDRVFPGDASAGTADILYIRPIDSRPYHTLITAGMSSVAMHVPPDTTAPRRLELMMTLPETWQLG